MKITILLFSFLLPVNAVCGQKASDLNQKAFTFETAYIGDVVRNFSGGIKKGTCYLGLASLGLKFDTEAAGFWKGGQFLINAANVHGGNPSADLIGDFHIVSNIEADKMTYVHELWFSQTFGSFEAIAGLQDLNSDFISSEYGSLFINSTFGTPSTIADNIHSPIYPYTAPGISLKWNINERNILKIAAFDGLPEEREKKYYNLKWRFSKDQGVFVVSEYNFTGQLIKNLKSSYRTGAYVHTHSPQPDSTLTGPAESRSNYGIYFIADQMIYQEPSDKGGVGIFCQLAFSPGSLNSHNTYLGLGLSWQGVFRNRDMDKLGVAVTNAGFHDTARNGETVIELNYLLQITDWFFVQPDIQYVINPGDTVVTLDNSFVGLLRFGVTF
ncbi:MAG TPA: carbohydrate porin [Bacteroidales bacterium]|nr:carbohydrate porin [Bacteroidales bacterium]